MYLKQLIQLDQTVFTIEDLRQIWQIGNNDYLKTIIYRLFKRGELFRIKNGIYSIKKEYNIFELSNKLKQPSYIGLETVLQQEGVIFQDYSNAIYSVSNNTKQIANSGITFYYFKLKNSLLTNPIGIENKNFVRIASVERSLADRVYLTPGYYFDNLRKINTKKLRAISKIYNKRTQAELKGIINFINKNYA